ncbi:LysM domain-containing protein [Nonomuraea deserti]|uniref:LysM domain-containing protein n=1 Tax=Nonomuraea deserti TaxID=1848322 RepID=A0A4R4W373_9ACTN|nr:LysM peptidoglycan-binding domain-containing protein [Nonomuraea deserti]TDD09944.1 LysM domain-containing protein [Nonomuraea deserti]
MASSGFSYAGPEGLEHLKRAGMRSQEAGESLAEIRRSFVTHAKGDVNSYALIQDGAAELASGYNQFFRDLSDSMYRRGSALSNCGSNLKYSAANYGWSERLLPPDDPPPFRENVELPDPGTLSVTFNATLDLLGLGDDYERKLLEMQQACKDTARRLRALQPDIDAVEDEVEKARWGGDAAQTYHAAWTEYVNPSGGGRDQAQTLEQWAARSEHSAEILGNAVDETQRSKHLVKRTLQTLAAIGVIMAGAAILNPAVRAFLVRMAKALRQRAMLVIKLLRARLKLLGKGFGSSVAARGPVLSGFMKNGLGVAGANYINSSIANSFRGVENPWAISPGMLGTLAFLFGLGGGFALVKNIGAVTRLAQAHPVRFTMGLEFGLNAGAATALSMTFENKSFGAALKDGLIVGGVGAAFGLGSYAALRDATGLKHLAWRKANKWGTVKFSAGGPMSATNVRYGRILPGNHLAQMKLSDGTKIWLPKNGLTYRARQIGPINSFLQLDPFWKNRILGLIPGTINYTLVPRGQSEPVDLTIPDYRNWDHGSNAEPPRSGSGQPPGATTHTVRSGDTLEAIAQREYGSARYASLLQQANWQLDGINQGHLSPGQQLVIPELEKEKVS